jgi:hypothetical protein
MKKLVLFISIAISGMLIATSCDKESSDSQIEQKVKGLSVFIDTVEYFTFDFQYKDGVIQKIFVQQAVDNFTATYEFVDGKIDKIYSNNNSENTYLSSFIHYDNKIIETNYQNNVLYDSIEFMTNVDDKIISTFYRGSTLHKFYWEYGNRILIEMVHDENNDNPNIIMTYNNKNNPLRDIVIPPHGFYFINILDGSSSLLSTVSYENTDVFYIYSYEYNSNGNPTVVKASDPSRFDYTYYYEYY